MAEYLTKFENHAEYESEKSSLEEPNVSLCSYEGEVHYKGTDWSKEYLTFVALEDGEITFNYGDTIDGAFVREIKYSFDKENWETASAGQGVSLTAEVEAGDMVYWGGDNVKICSSNTAYSYFTTTCKVNVMGNVASLFDDVFTGYTTANTYDFAWLFADTLIVSAKNLVLPYETLANYCYSKMFSGCTELIEAPELPSESLANYCYNRMFQGCTKLKKGPKLPAMTLANYCYNCMFYNCTSLTKTPNLSAITLNNGSYYGMFYNCTSLVKPPRILAETISEKSCYLMFGNCSSLKVAPTIHASSVGNSGCSAMFSACTSLVTAPELSAATVSDRCYLYMFTDCSGLTTPMKILPATTLVESCYARMFYKCPSLLSCPQLPATELQTNCYRDMFALDTSLMKSPILPAETLVDGCYAFMFSGCTKLNYVYALFTSEPTPGMETGNTYSWLYGVSSSGNFVKNANAQWTTTGPNGVPTNWTVTTTTDLSPHYPPSS